MKQHMEYIVANDEKKYSFKECALDQAEENCKDLSNQTFFVQDASIHEKASLSDINNLFSRKVETLTDKEISQAIEQDEDFVVGLFFPFSIVVSSMGPVSMGRVQYVRCFVNLKTGKIYTAYGGKMGQMFDPYF